MPKSDRSTESEGAPSAERSTANEVISIASLRVSRGARSGAVANVSANPLKAEGALAWRRRNGVPACKAMDVKQAGGAKALPATMGRAGAMLGARRQTSERSERVPRLSVGFAPIRVSRGACSGNVPQVCATPD